jgi:hypothetical protein
MRLRLRLVPSWLQRERRRPAVDEILPQVDALLSDLRVAVAQLQRQQPPRNGAVPARRGTR